MPELGKVFIISKWHLWRELRLIVGFLPQILIALGISGLIYVYRIFPMIRDAGKSSSRYLIAIPVILLAFFPRRKVKFDAESRNRYAVGGLGLETESMVTLVQACKRDLFVNAILWLLLLPLLHFNSKVAAIFVGVGSVVATTIIKNLPVLLLSYNQKGNINKRLIRYNSTEARWSGRLWERLKSLAPKQNIIAFAIVFAVLYLGASDLIPAIADGSSKDEEWVQRILALSIIAGSFSSAVLIDLAYNARLTIYRQNPVSFLAFIFRHFRVAMLWSVISLSPLLYCQYLVSPLWGVVTTVTVGLLLTNALFVGLYQPLSSAKLQVSYFVGSILVTLSSYWNAYIAIAACMVIMIVFAVLSRHTFYHTEVQE